MNYIEMSAKLAVIAGAAEFGTMPCEHVGLLKDAAVLLRATGEREALLKKLVDKLMAMQNPSWVSLDDQDKIAKLIQQIDSVQTRMGA